MLDVGVGAGLELIGDHPATRDGLERDRTDKARRRVRHHRDDLVSALLQPARNLDSLVGADAASYAERDQSHDYSTGFDSASIFSTCRVITSVCATVVFLCSPTATRGVDPASSCRARAPAVTTNSNELESLLRSIMVCVYPSK